MENRIAERSHDLEADGFCLKKFSATEAAFRSVLLLFNLLAEFQRASEQPACPAVCAPATIRAQVLTCNTAKAHRQLSPGVLVPCRIKEYSQLMRLAVYFKYKTPKGNSGGESFKSLIRRRATTPA